MQSAEAARSLDAVHSSRARLADKPTPASRHLAFAALFAGLVAAPAAPTGLRFPAITLLIIVALAIKQWDMRRTGMFINGYRRGRTRRVAAVLLVFFVPLYVLSAWLADNGVRWAALPLAAVAGVAAYLCSIWWCRVFAREMRDEA